MTVNIFGEKKLMHYESDTEKIKELRAMAEFIAGKFEVWHSVDKIEIRFKEWENE